MYRRGSEHTYREDAWLQPKGPASDTAGLAGYPSVLGLIPRNSNMPFVSSPSPPGFRSSRYAVLLNRRLRDRQKTFSLGKRTDRTAANKEG